MNRFTTVIILLYLIIATGCDKSQTFSNYAGCVLKKKAEYIDLGANAWEGESRAEAFCETKYPLLQPSYQSISNVTITVDRDTICFPQMKIYCKYTFHLSRPVDLVTFSLSNRTGPIGSLTRVEPYAYGQKISWTPQEPDIDGPVISAEVIEALVDINKGKHQGD